MPTVGARSASAKYAPSANSDPCARLITSITPRISMNPSAMRANSSPRLIPLTRCGSNCARKFIMARPCVATLRTVRTRCPSACPDQPRDEQRSQLEGRRRVVAFELAGHVVIGAIERVFALGPAHDLEQVGLVHRLVVTASHVDRLLQMMRGRIHIGI